MGAGQGAVADRLYELYTQHGELTVEIVIEDARAKDSPLHSEFSWNVKEAAYAYWKYQARKLISSVRVETRTETMVVTSVAYVQNPVEGRGYVPVSKVRSDKEMAREVLLDEFGRAASALIRTRELAAVFGMTKEVETLLEGVQTARQRVLPAADLAAAV